MAGRIIIYSFDPFRRDVKSRAKIRLPRSLCLFRDLSSLAPGLLEKLRVAPSMDFESSGDQGIELAQDCRTFFKAPLRPTYANAFASKRSPSVEDTQNLGSPVSEEGGKKFKTTTRPLPFCSSATRGTPLDHSAMSLDSGLRAPGQKKEDRPPSSDRTPSMMG